MLVERFALLAVVMVLVGMAAGVLTSLLLSAAPSGTSITTDMRARLYTLPGDVLVVRGKIFVTCAGECGVTVSKIDITGFRNDGSVVLTCELRDPVHLGAGTRGIPFTCYQEITYGAIPQSLEVVAVIYTSVGEYFASAKAG